MNSYDSIPPILRTKSVKFCASLLMGATLAMLIDLSHDTQNKVAKDKVEELQETQVMAQPTPENIDVASTKLLAIALPEPPALATPKQMNPGEKIKQLTANELASNTQVSKQSEPQKSLTDSPKKNESLQDQAPKNMSEMTKQAQLKTRHENEQTTEKVVNANTANAQNIGFKLMQDAEALEHWRINISMPQSPSSSQAISKVLRDSLGVTLGKVSAEGKLIAKEQSGQASPFVRIVAGSLTQAEQRIVYPWKNLKGNIVRFYPLDVDAKLFGGLHLLGLSQNDHAEITAVYKLENGKLYLNQIRVNGKPYSQSILLAQNV